MARLFFLHELLFCEELHVHLAPLICHFIPHITDYYSCQWLHASLSQWTRFVDALTHVPCRKVSPFHLFFFVFFQKSQGNGPLNRLLMAAKRKYMDTELPPQESEGKVMDVGWCLHHRSPDSDSQFFMPVSVFIYYGKTHEHVLTVSFFLLRPLPGFKPTPRDMAHRRWDFSAGTVFSLQPPWTMIIEPFDTLGLVHTVCASSRRYWSAFCHISFCFDEGAVVKNMTSIKKRRI